MKETITGKTGLLGIIGSPVTHSLSPAMHNFSLQHLGLDYVYLAFPLEGGKAGEALDSVRLLGIRGINVTMPHKQAVVPFLDEVSPIAQIMGAVNTVVNKNGRLVGHNTDGNGIVGAFAEEGISLKGKTITLFGTGGAGSSALVAAATQGARRIYLYNRSGKAEEPLQAILTQLKEIAPECAVTLHSMGDLSAKKENVTNSEIIINATLLGMNPQPETTPMEEPSWLASGQIVMDAVYNPLVTRFMGDAAAQGCKVIGGRGMLLWQGAEAFRLFTGKEMPVKEVRAHIFRGEEGV